MSRKLSLPTELKPELGKYLFKACINGVYTLSKGYKKIHTVYFEISHI